jgi:hypothetical protein
LHISWLFAYDPRDSILPWSGAKFANKICSLVFMFARVGGLAAPPALATIVKPVGGQENPFCIDQII